MSYGCDSCGDRHDTIEELVACPELNREPEVPPSGAPIHCRRKMIPIVSGYPSHSMLEASDRDEIEWTGTCIAYAGQPNWSCPSCGRSFTLPGGPNVGGVASVTLDDREVDWSEVPDPPWWTKVRMRLQYWVTGDA